jgi:hypothetical protein
MAMVKVLDSITKLTPDFAGTVLVAGSHGGLYPGYLAAMGRLRGVILNDASVGKDEAGIASLAWLDRLGMAAATVDARSARIGDGADMMARGRISHVNATARGLGAAPGQGCAECAERLERGKPFDGEAPHYDESRFLFRDGAPSVWGLDSISLVRDEDKGMIVIAGSHGALLAGKPETACRVDVRAAVFHDAGIGIDRAGVSRLPALDARGIAAACVAAASARIGDARSLWATGVLSVVNETADGSGAKPGMRVQDFVEIVT